MRSEIGGSMRAFIMKVEEVKVKNFGAEYRGCGYCSREFWARLGR